MKTYRPARKLFTEVESLLAHNKPSFHHSPLDDVIELLSRGRHYSWVGIYLTVGETAAQQLLGAGGEADPGRVTLPGTRTKILVSLKLAGRELGVLSVESDRENAFAAEDRVLLEKTADLLARFLAGPGKYLARQARKRVAGSASRSASVGEK